MGRKKDVDKMAMSEVHKDLTPEELEFISKVKAGRKDPIYFANEILGVPLHDKQKLWLWLTTKTQTEKCYELGLKLAIWIALEEFEKYKVFEFQKNILVPSNRWGKTLVTSVKHLWYCYYKIGVKGAPEHVGQERCGTLNLSPHSNQCDAGYQYIKDILENKFMWLDADGKSHTNKSLIGEGTVNPNGTFLVGENTQKRILRFLNGTTYKAVPTGEDQASSLAGTPYLYISYDECAQCYSDDTEVLTDLGWKKFYNVAIGELVPSINIETGLVEKVKVKSVINEPYEGDMIQFGGEKQQFTDLLVTPNHKMLVAKSKGANQYGSFAFEEAGNLIGKQFKLNQSFTATGRESAYFMIPAYRNKMSGSGLYVRGERKVVVEDFLDRKSTRLNSSHSQISYAVFCLK